MLGLVMYYNIQIQMAYFLPEKMTYCQALVSSEIAWDVFNQLGQLEKVALASQTINYQNPFIRSLRRCDQTLGKVVLIRNLLEQYRGWVDFSLREATNNRTVWEQFKRRIQEGKVEGHLYINHIEDEIAHSHDFLTRQAHEMEALNKRVAEVIYQMGLLATLAAQGSLRAFLGRPGSMEQALQRGTLFQSRCICISRKELMMLKKGLFRITRGNSWVYELEINMQELGRYFTNPKHRALAQDLTKDRLACFIMYQKGERNMLLNKINKFLGCFDSHILAADIGNMREELPRLQRKIVELEAMEELTLESMRKHIDRLCQVREESTVSWLAYMELYTKKEREVYRALSTTQVSKNLVRFHLYIPTKELPLIIQPKINLPPLILNVLQSERMPPSKFDTNVMMQIPQAIVNTYGVPSYSEINPAPFYIVTFGFFIGVMFGDVGHMLMAIPLLIHFKANLWFWTVVFWMGYCGLIYNQFFGLNFGLFSSCYTISQQEKKFSAVRQENCVFSFGIDSVWKVADNEMAFTNSLKMKVAVILGVVHMIFGLFIKLYNNIRQKQWVDLITLTLPQMLFMSCTFLYMDYLILYKWNHQWADSKTAPSIISTMISVYVNMARDNPKDFLFWPEERRSERVIVALAIICVPIMLLGKTSVIFFQRRNKSNNNNGSHQEINQLAEQQDGIEMEEIEHDKFSDESMKKEMVSNKKEHEHEEPIQEIAVHQFIETIEFVLGSVSNTASYLRLWALSLAHAQLASVIFQLTVLKMLQGGYSKVIALFLVFPFYFATTFGVLLCMDSLECFLHSLRLHWVQFQNKFYQGRGYQFDPFTFRKIK